jgi:hypothetical protein
MAGVKSSHQKTHLTVGSNNSGGDTLCDDDGDNGGAIHMPPRCFHAMRVVTHAALDTAMRAEPIPAISCIKESQSHVR